MRSRPRPRPRSRARCPRPPRARAPPPAGGAAGRAGVRAGGGRRRAGPAALAAPPGAGPADAAYVLFTSGSTGRPKAVVVEHRQLARYVAGVHELTAPPPGAGHLVLQSPT